jgi:hypothetical protein
MLYLMGRPACAEPWQAIGMPMPTVPSAAWTSSTNLKAGEQILIGPVTFGNNNTSIGILNQESPDSARWGWFIPINGKDHTLGFTGAAQNRFQELVIAVPATNAQTFPHIKIFKQDGDNITRFFEETTVGAVSTLGATQTTLLRQPNGRFVLLVVDATGYFLCYDATNDEGTAYTLAGVGTAVQLKALVNRTGRIGIFANVMNDRRLDPAGGQIQYIGQARANTGCVFHKPIPLGGFAFWRLDAGIDASGRFQVVSENRFGGERRVQVIRQLQADNDQLWDWPVFLSPVGEGYSFPAVTTDAFGRLVIAAEGPSGIESTTQIDPHGNSILYGSWVAMGSILPNGTAINHPFWGKNRDGRLTLFGFNQTDYLYYVRAQTAPGQW